MKKIPTLKLQRKAVAAAALLAVFGTVQAADWEVSGQLRQDIAVKTTRDQNANNQYGSLLNGVAHTNKSGPAMTFLESVGAFSNPPGTPGTPGGLATAAFLSGRDLTRPASFADKADFNSFSTRLELNFDGKISENLKATIKLRAVSEQVDAIDSVFKNRDGAAGQYANSFYQQQTHTPLSSGNKHTLVDLPAAYVDYSTGPLWVRAGNQQIAWGEAMFFRIADIPNGLDLRGQLFGPAAEEYSNSRRSALGLRTSYRVTEKLEVEGFAQMALPTLLPNGETPNNFIADAFDVRERQGYEDIKRKVNLGFRLRNEIGGFGVQAFAVNRYNPDGVFKWQVATDAGTIDSTAFRAGFASGVYNSEEWFRSAAMSRLDGIRGLDEALNQITAASPSLPGTQGIAIGCGVAPANVAQGNFKTGTRAAAACIVDSFFSIYGPLRGDISRKYDRETVLGFGVNRVFTGEPDSLMDQLIGRFELSYTPKKLFTNPSLGNYIEKDEVAFAFIAEKYHKFTSSFPATYFVAQWMHKTQSDIFGRYLGGVNNSAADGTPRGQSGGFNAVALALQQPSPTLEYRFDFAILTDLKGGYYIQPGVRWKPTKSFIGDLYANIVTSSKKDQYKNFTAGLEHNNEILARASWLF